MSVKRIFAFVLALCLAICFCSCSDSSEPVVLSYGLQANPTNLDPQSASSPSAFTVLYATMEGLYRFDETGTPVLGVAEKEPEISTDQKKYTFTIREDAVWTYLNEDKQEQTIPVTADDFVFAFERLLSPQTKSPAAERFYCIKNASEIHAGTMAPETIGVRAIDEKTLVIELETPTDYFESLLATTYAMPCNREFFESTNGRYGLNRTTVRSNGMYRIGSWDETTQIRLDKNAYYHAPEIVFADTVRLRIPQKDDASDLERLSDDIVNGVFVSGQDAQVLDESEYRMIQMKDAVWGIQFQTADGPFENASIRQAVSLCFDRAVYQSKLPSYLTATNTIIPEDAMLFGKMYELLQKTDTIDPAAAYTAYQKGLSELSKNSITGAKLLVCESDAVDVASYFSDISQILQRDLSLFLSVESLPQKEYTQKLKNGDYDLAVVCLTSSDNNALTYLSSYASTAANNTSGYQNMSFDALLSEANSADQSGQALALCRQAEEQLLSDNVFLPMMWQSKVFATKKATEGLVYLKQTGVVHFMKTTNETA